MSRKYLERHLVRGVLFFVVMVLLGGPLLRAEEPVAKKPAEAEREDGEKKKKKKIPPFKYSAWCSFRDFMDVQRVDPEKLKQLATYDEEKDSDTRPGSQQWGGYARRGQWVSLVVEMQNTTEDKPYTGDIRVQLDPSKASTETGEKPYTTRYRQSFELAPKTTQSFYFSVLCPEFYSDQVRIVISTNRGSFERSVGLYDLDGRREDLTVVVSDRSSAFKFLTLKPGDDVDTGRTQGALGRKVAVVQPADLPNRWYNLTLANLIILDGPPREGLTDEQLEALRGYCQAGGQLLISTGTDPARLRAAEGRALSVADLAGIRVRELSRVKQLDLARGWSLGETDDGLPVVDVTPVHEGGAVSVYRNRQTGLVERMRRQVGLGAVTFLSFSLSEDKLKTWPERASIPLKLLEESRQRTLFSYQEEGRESQQALMGLEDEEPVSREPLEVFRDKLDGSFSEDTPVETPKRGVVAAFLLLFLLVVVPLNYFLFGWFRRREIAWAAVPVWALVFSIGAYVVGFQQGRLTVDQLSVVEAGPNEPEGLARTFMGVFAPRYGYYRFRFDPDDRLKMAPQAGPGHLVSRSYRTRGITSFLPEMDVFEEASGELQIEDLKILARSTRRLEVQHRASLGQGIGISMAPDGTGKTNVELKNGSPFHLINAVLAYRGADSRWRAVRLGNIARGAAVPQKFNGVSMGPRDGQDVSEVFFARPPVVQAGVQEITMNRARDLGAFVQPCLNRYHETLLLAWIEGGMLPVTISRGTQAMEDAERGMTMLLLPVREGAAGGSKSWSGLFTTDQVRLDQAEWEPFSFKNGRVRFLQVDAQNGLTSMELRAPEGTQDLEDRDFSFSFKMRALTQQEFNQRNSGQLGYNNDTPVVPTACSGTVVVEIASWNSNLTLSGWRTIDMQNAVFQQLKAGNRQAFSFRHRMERDELGPQNKILLRVRLTRMKASGAVWSEVDWPLELFELQPDITGRSTTR